MPFFEVTGKMIDYNKEAGRYEKYSFRDAIMAATAETAADKLLSYWRSNPDTDFKVLNPKKVVKSIKPYEGEISDSLYTKTFIEVVDPSTFKRRSVTTRLNERSFRH